MVYTMINLHLLSTPGDRDIRWVLDACRPYLKDKDEPTVAFLPMASLNVNHSPYAVLLKGGLPMRG